ncbi:hypothetical protein [Streptomyces sp. NPDC056632]|uniref:hypothetical protein n=1 Tax=Streptomyces sp. NPDC056632 TaxID=3345884 RepID=UPI0036CCC098
MTAEPHRSPTNTRFVSDHLPVRAAAYWTDCGAPGTNPGAVLRRDVNGDLYRYGGVPTVRSAVLAKPCKVGSGWQTMKHVARQRTTLVAIDSAGQLWHYRVGADGSYPGGAGRTLAGSGFENDDLLVAAGDWDGDGTTDLITRRADELWFHKGLGVDSYKPRELLADLAPWEIVGSMVAGDFVGTDSPGPELITVAETGHLLLRTRDKETGALSAPKEIGTGWGVYGTALIGPGDLNNDGHPDLVGRDEAGKLFYYKCDGAGGYAARDEIGTSFPAGEMLF